tara:strand:- start:112 stop:516 length:405 start_codon:yes stop_codon:yes gene_type:complete
MINLKRLNRIYIKGLTIKELIAILNKEYSTYVKNPNVQILIKEYRLIKVFIEGEVENPGLYVLKAKSISSKNSPFEDNTFGYKAATNNRVGPNSKIDGPNDPNWPRNIKDSNSEETAKLFHLCMRQLEEVVDLL